MIQKVIIKIKNQILSLLEHFGLPRKLAMTTKLVKYLINQDFLINQKPKQYLKNYAKNLTQTIISCSN